MRQSSTLMDGCAVIKSSWLSSQTGADFIARRVGALGRRSRACDRSKAVAAHDHSEIRRSARRARPACRERAQMPAIETPSLSVEDARSGCTRRADVRTSRAASLSIRRRPRSSAHEQPAHRRGEIETPPCRRRPLLRAAPSPGGSAPSRLASRSGWPVWSAGTCRCRRPGSACRSGADDVAHRARFRRVGAASCRTPRRARRRRRAAARRA